jgi:hypothetical protein
MQEISSYSFKPILINRCDKKNDIHEYELFLLSMKKNQKNYFFNNTIFNYSS